MKVLIHFMHNPWPPRSGAHRRCLWLMGKFVDAGAEVILCSSTTHSEQPWSDDAKAALEKSGIKSVRVFAPNRITRAIDKVARKLSARRKQTVNTIYEEMKCGAAYKKWFQFVVEREKPDAIVMNYAWFDQLMRHDRWPHIRRYLDTLDIVAITRDYRQRATALLAERAAGAPPEQVYNLNFIRDCPLPNIDAELAICEQYNTTIAISERDREILNARLTNSTVKLMPVGEQPRPLRNEYREGIVLAMGPNPFNELGLGVFCELVWPLALKLNPRIKAYITGSVSPPCAIPNGIEHLGFVANLDPLFEKAKFAVSPVFVGTGQQIKIVEYLACGLGVVAFDVPTVTPLLKSGISGILVQSTEEMAEAIAELYEDEPRCRRYGKTAREMVAQDYEGNEHFCRAFGDLMKSD